MFEHNAHQRITGAPRYAATTSLLTAAKEYLSFPTSLATLRCEGRAAQWRLAHSTSKDFFKLNETLESVKLFDEPYGDECLFTPRFPDWLNKTSIFANINSTIQFIDAICPIIREDTADSDHLQACVSKHLRPLVRRERPEVVVSRRFKRWFPDHDALAARAPATLKIIVKLKRANFLCAVVKTWLNAWCMTHRFQEGEAPCHFGCGCSRGDRISHYSHCPAVADFYRRACPWLPPLPTDPTIPPYLFFAIDSEIDAHHVHTLAMLVYVVYMSYESRRCTRQSKGFNPSWDASILDANLALFMCKDSIYNNLVKEPMSRQSR